MEELFDEDRREAPEAIGEKSGPEILEIGEIGGERTEAQ